MQFTAHMSEVFKRNISAPFVIQNVIKRSMVRDHWEILRDSSALGTNSKSTQDLVQSHQWPYDCSDPESLGWDDRRRGRRKE